MFLWPQKNKYSTLRQSYTYCTILWSYGWKNELEYLFRITVDCLENFVPSLVFIQGDSKILLQTYCKTRRKSIHTHMFSPKRTSFMICTWSNWFMLRLHQECLHHKVIVLGDPTCKIPEDWVRENVQVYKMVSINEYVCMDFCPCFRVRKPSPKFMKVFLNHTHTNTHKLHGTTSLEESWLPSNDFFFSCLVTLISHQKQINER